MKIAGKTVLITGAAKRIGREIALTLAKKGAEFVLHYRRSEKEAVQLQKEILSLGANVSLAPCDFELAGRPLQPVIREFIKKIYSQVSRIDVLINNASVFYPTLFGKISEKDWDRFLDVNLKVPFFLAQEIGIRMFRQKSGKIINLTDWTAERPALRFLPYAISKAGLAAATKGLAKNLAPYVQVMSVAPGPILPAVHTTKKEQKLAAEKSLLKQYGSPKDIAATVQFLIESTDFMTGSTVYVDGGANLA